MGPGTHQKTEPALMDLTEFREWCEERSIPILPKLNVMRKRGWESFHVLVRDELEIEFKLRWL